MSVPEFSEDFGKAGFEPRPTPFSPPPEPTVALLPPEPAPTPLVSKRRSFFGFSRLANNILAPVPVIPGLDSTNGPDKLRLPALLEQAQQQQKALFPEERRYVPVARENSLHLSPTRAHKSLTLRLLFRAKKSQLTNNLGRHDSQLVMLVGMLLVALGATTRTSILAFGKNVFGKLKSKRRGPQSLFSFRMGKHAENSRDADAVLIRTSNTANFNYAIAQMSEEHQKDLEGDDGAGADANASNANTVHPPDIIIEEDPIEPPKELIEPKTPPKTPELLSRVSLLEDPAPPVLDGDVLFPKLLDIKEVTLIVQIERQLSTKRSDSVKRNRLSIEVKAKEDGMTIEIGKEVSSPNVTLKKTNLILKKKEPEALHLDTDVGDIVEEVKTPDGGSKSLNEFSSDAVSDGSSLTKTDRVPLGVFTLLNLLPVAASPRDQTEGLEVGSLSRDASLGEISVSNLPRDLSHGSNMTSVSEANEQDLPKERELLNEQKLPKKPHTAGVDDFGIRFEDLNLELDFPEISVADDVSSRSFDMEDENITAASRDDLITGALKKELAKKQKEEEEATKKQGKNNINKFVKNKYRLAENIRKKDQKTKKLPQKRKNELRQQLQKEQTEHGQQQQETIAQHQKNQAVQRLQQQQKQQRQQERLQQRLQQQQQQHQHRKNNLFNLLVNFGGKNTTVKRRGVKFLSRITLYETYNAEDYDRHPEVATCNQLTPMLAQQIKEELNGFKAEMAVHEESRCYTHFF